MTVGPKWLTCKWAQARWSESVSEAWQGRAVAKLLHQLPDVHLCAAHCHRIICIAGACKLSQVGCAFMYTLCSYGLRMRSTTNISNIMCALATCCEHASAGSAAVPCHTRHCLEFVPGFISCQGMQIVQVCGVNATCMEDYPGAHSRVHLAA